MSKKINVLDDLNSTAEVIKTAIKLIPPNLFENASPLINEFYSLLTKIESDITTSKKVYDEIMKIRNDLASSLTKNKENLKNISSKIQSLSL